MRKATKRKHWGAVPPALRLLDNEVKALQTRIHMGAACLDTEDGLELYCKTLCECTVAMEVDGTHDKNSDALLRTGIKKLEKAIQDGRLHVDDEAYLQQLALNVDDWIAAGRVTMRGLATARRLVKQMETDK